MTRRHEWIRQHAAWEGEQCLRWPFSSGDWYHSVNVGGKFTKAHRLMCKIAHGAPPTDDHYALHSCGNKWCVNPKHLRWGTSAENFADARNHGAILFGERAPCAIFTEETVLEARRLKAEGWSYSALERRYGISKGAIWHAVKGSQWGHVK